jgi:hypothetical protein
MDLKVNNKLLIKRVILALPFLILFLIQLSKINNDIVSFAEVWWIISPFKFLEPMRGGHAPYYYYLVRFFQLFNIFGITPYVYLRFINCLFNIAALFYIYKTFKVIFDEKIAFLTIFCLSLGSFFLGTTVTTVRYPLVNFLFFFSLYNLLMYLRVRSDRYFIMFFAGGLIVTSLDVHAVFGCLFVLFYILFYRIHLDRKLIIAVVLLGINFIITNLLIFIVARRFIWHQVGWHALQNNINYFVGESMPNLFFNTLTFKYPIIMWISFLILFCFFILIMAKIRDRRVMVIVSFVVCCFLFIALVQYATKLQCFIVKYLIFLIPFMFSLFFYVIPGRRKIMAYLFCFFIGFNTAISYSSICASDYTYIFRAIERYKPTVCLSLYDSGFVPETILRSLYPSIQVERVKAINNDTSYKAKALLLVSTYNSINFNLNKVKILNIPLLGYTRVLGYYFEYCPGNTSVYSIYTSMDNKSLGINDR